MYIDTHAHLNFREYKDEIPEVIKRAQEAKVEAIINVGSNFNTSKKCVEIAIGNSPLAVRKSPKANSQQPIANLYSAVGVHPIHLVKDITESATFDGRTYSFTTKQEDFDYQKFKKLALSSQKVVAIGETGLDYFHNSDDRTIQKKVFREHIRLAKELNLPLILHCRGEENDPYGVYDEMLKILNSQFIIRDSKTSGGRGVIHCYGGNLEQAKQFIDLGFCLGVNGIVTFKNAKQLQLTLKDCPLEKMLIETDCPFLAPEPYRGERNEPAFVVEVAKKIAQLKNIPLSEVEKTATQNAINLFKLKLEG